jgi:medium-chain acyl-[acyl-carrier-protein] hydrolase
MVTQTSWIRCYKPNAQARLRLFCFPYAGGSASVFRTWADQLPDTLEVCSIQLPGREDRYRELPYRQLSDLLPVLLPAFDAFFHLPFVFFGHSVGALICFELARHFRQQGYPVPLHLFVSGRGAPQVPALDPPIHQLPDAQFLQELRAYDGTPEVVLRDPELLSLFLPLLRADLAIQETYLYKDEPPLSCPISAFGGLDDQKVSSEALLAWQAQTCTAFKVERLPGGHFFLKSANQALLRLISSMLPRILDDSQNS